MTKTMRRHIFLLDVITLKNFINFRNNLPEIMKISNCMKLVCNFHDKKNYVVHIRAFKQASNHVLVFRKVCRII